uniref:Uncharacterized protein n=1 Tax=Rhizophora mucronata TaxID=61149 RepID=A0A2P2R2V0_RHIMU
MRLSTELFSTSSFSSNHNKALN